MSAIISRICNRNNLTVTPTTFTRARCTLDIKGAEFNSVGVHYMRVVYTKTLRYVG